MTAHQLQHGDLVFFERIGFARAWRGEGWRGILGSLAQGVIALAQWLRAPGPQGAQDGMWRFVHVGIVLAHQGELMLMEFTASAPAGMHLLPAAQRLNAYGGKVLIAPLSERYAALLSPVTIAQWIEAHRRDRYRWLGLPCAIAQVMLGSRACGAMFCSESVVNLLVTLGIVPRKLACWRPWGIVEGETEPQSWCPCDAARLPQLARQQMWEWTA